MLLHQLTPVVPIPIRHDRNKLLRNLSYTKMQNFTLQHAGNTRKVLFETVNKNNTVEGYTDNYIKVSAAYKAGIENEIVDWVV